MRGHLSLLETSTKTLLSIFVSLLLAAAVAAQDRPSVSLARGTWELGPLIGGGSGLGKSSGTQFFYLGGRGGLVLTREHLPGILRGDFEWAVDAAPVYTVITPRSTVYGGSFKPVIWQWNFTNGEKFAPYLAAAGGIVFTTRDVPPGDTSKVNFTSQLVVGTRVFTKPRRAFFVEGALGHFSNASLGNHNPGYNVTLVFTLGYSWLKPRK